MYKLLVKRHGTDTFQQVDFGDDKPVMTYSVNNLAELKNKMADYSQRLKLPKTPNNCRIFDHIQCYQVKSKVPYRRHECRLYLNSIELAGRGSLITLYDVTEFFEIGISTGIYDFFKQLQAINFTSDDYKDILGVAVRSFQELSVGDNYFSVNCYAGGGVRTDTLVNGVRVYDYPFTYFQKSLDKLLAYTGYTMESDVNMDESGLVHSNYKTLSLVDRKPYDNEVCYKTDTYENIVHPNETQPPKQNSYQFPFVTNECNIGVRVTVEVDSANKGFDGLYLKYNSANWIVSVNRLLDNPADGSWAELEGGNLKKSVDIFSNGTIMSSAGEQASFTKPYDVVPLDANVTFGFYTQYEGCNSVKIEFIIKPNTTYAIPGQKMSIAANLGIKNAKDLLKLYLQLYGLTVHVDNRTKTIYAYLLDHIYENKPNAKDWTDKLNEKSIDETFVIEGYAQRNTILLKENKKNGIQESVLFTVDNQCLEDENEMFTLELESGQREIITWHSLAEDGIVEFRKLDAPHLLNLDKNPSIWSITHTSIQSLFNYGYSGLMRMLTDTKVVEAEFLITELDILNFDRFTPVYLKQFGRYFYVMEICNFGARELTKCKLVKM